MKNGTQGLNEMAERKIMSENNGSNDRAIDEHALFKGLSRLKNPTEVERFLRDLATPAELAAFAERWRIARMLDRGDHSYREIAASTGASTTTIGRVARFLREERYQGYRLVLDRMNADGGDRS